MVNLILHATRAPEIHRGNRHGTQSNWLPYFLNMKRRMTPVSPKQVSKCWAETIFHILPLPISPLKLTPLLPLPRKLALCAHLLIKSRVAINSHVWQKWQVSPNSQCFLCSKKNTNFCWALGHLGTKLRDYVSQHPLQPGTATVKCHELNAEERLVYFKA